MQFLHYFASTIILHFFEEKKKSHQEDHIIMFLNFIAQQSLHAVYMQYQV